MTTVSRAPSVQPAHGDTLTAAGRSHEVRHGETLHRIAAEHGVSLQALLAANPQVRNPDVIYPGTRLQLPEAPRHVVKPGDTLQAIAREHGVSLQALQAANPQLRDPDLIRAGEWINLPPLGEVTDSLPLASEGPLRSLLNLLSPVFMLNPAYRAAVANRDTFNGTVASHGALERNNALGADPTGLHELAQRQLAEPAPVRADGARAAPTLDLRRFTDPALGSNAPAAIVIGNAEGTRRPDGGFTRAYGGHTDPGNAAHNRGSFSYQHSASSPADADRRQLTTLQGRLPAYEAAARRAGLDPANARLASAYLDLYNQSPSAAGRFLNQLGSLRGQPLDAAHIASLRVNSYVDASTGQRFRLANGGQAGSGFANIARQQLGRTPSEAEVQAVIRADQQRRTNAVETALNRQGLLRAPTATAAAVPTAAPAAAAPRWLAIARGELGTNEVRGARDNARVVEYHQATTLRARNDETSWCSSFVNWTMQQAGVQGTRSAAARSWLGWGQAVPRDAAHVRPGDVIVFPRGNNPAQGHVAIVESVQPNGRVTVIGGNQSTQRGGPDGVTRADRELADAIGVRRAP